MLIIIMTAWSMDLHVLDVFIEFQTKLQRYTYTATKVKKCECSLISHHNDNN